MIQPPFSHQPRKRFGQHFLHDSHVVDRIIHAIAPKPQDTFFEIGPGQGILTYALRPHIQQLFAIEIDRDLAEKLRAQFAQDAHFSLYEGDALAFKLTTLHTDNALRLVGNLPYNISSPLIFHLLTQHTCWHDAHFMLQKEVVDRMTATPGSKAYGRLSVMVQHACQATALFTVSNGAFTPPPRVTSAIVRLIPHTANVYPPVDALLFSEVVRLAFAHRRKMLHTALQCMVDRSVWEHAPIDSKLRAEKLSVSDFIALTQFIKEYRK